MTKFISDVLRGGELQSLSQMKAIFKTFKLSVKFLNAIVFNNLSISSCQQG